VLKHTGFLFDYMAGSRLEGFDNMVRLETQNKIAVFEGDEYLSSCMDPRPKFHLYQPHIALISGIAWDHINVFPTHEAYVNQFRIFIENMPPRGCLVYCQDDPLLKSLVEAGNPVAKTSLHNPGVPDRRGCNHADFRRQGVCHAGFWWAQHAEYHGS